MSTYANRPKTKLLIVDDDQDLLEVLKETLSELDCIVTGTSDPAEALELLEREGFDLVLSDIQMPRITGMDLMSASRQLGSEAHFVFISGVADFVISKQIPKVEHKVIEKPFRKNELLGTLDKVIRKIQFKAVRHRTAPVPA